MSPALDGDDVLTRVTVPLVKMYNKSYSDVFVVAIVETFVDPDKMRVVLVGVIDVAEAMVSPVNPNIPALLVSAFQAFTETWSPESEPVATVECLPQPCLAMY